MSNLKKFGPRQQKTASPEQEPEDTESGQFKIIKRPGDTFPIYEVRRCFSAQRGCKWWCTHIACLNAFKEVKANKRNIS